MPQLNFACYKYFFDNAPVALIRTEVKTAKILLANKRAAELFCFNSVTELKENKTTDFYSEKSRDKLIKLLKKQGFVENYEIEMVLPSKTIWVSISLTLSQDQTFIDAVLVDISDSIKVNGMLKDMGEKLDIKLALCV